MDTHEHWQWRSLTRISWRDGLHLRRGLWCRSRQPRRARAGRRMVVGARDGAPGQATGTVTRPEILTTRIRYGWDTRMTPHRDHAERGSADTGCVEEAPPTTIIRQPGRCLSRQRPGGWVGGLYCRGASLAVGPASGTGRVGVCQGQLGADTDRLGRLGHVTGVADSGRHSDRSRSDVGNMFSKARVGYARAAARRFVRAHACRCLTPRPCQLRPASAVRWYAKGIHAQQRIQCGL
jgi:hypothetical protein